MQFKILVITYKALWLRARLLVKLSTFNYFFLSVKIRKVGILWVLFLSNIILQDPGEMPSLLLAFAFGTASLPRFCWPNPACPLKSIKDLPLSPGTEPAEWIFLKLYVLVSLYLFFSTCFVWVYCFLLVRYFTLRHVWIQQLYKINKQIRIIPLLLTAIFHLTCLPYHFLRKLLDKILINPDRQINSIENSSRTLSIVPSYSDLLPYNLWSMTCNS